ncbi:dTDP-glucose 4,6-dehydratase [Akkermansiaceae bacterium]|nr:dTDP-glucose 4,6-dehydratase [Akkermansiaceae bacterium]
MRSLRSILLTGGAGFIGSALTRALLHQPHLEHLVILDSLTYAGNRANLIGPDQDPRLNFIEGDVGDEALISKLLKEFRCSGIMHLAAETHVDQSIETPAKFITTNINGTFSILNAARCHGVALLQCSTDEVYGPIVAPTKADESFPLNPSSPYSASKASADLIVQAAHITFGQEVVIARCSNNYGPRQHREKLIPTLVHHALRDEALPIYGSGKQIRDWIHVDDTARGLIRVFEKGVSNRIYNLGANCERPNLEIARAVLNNLNKPKSLIDHIEDRPGHDTRYAVDSTRAIKELGWQPKIPFQTGFEKVIRELSVTLGPN